MHGILVDSAERASVSEVAPAQKFRPFYCCGCGHRLLWYTPETLGVQAVIRVRCRDCKTFTDLRGANVPALIETIARGQGGT